ncbi:MAG: DUF1611 domain-containing protein [Sandarakinorhabdus sp.]|nr:DUF1611 domain-containing protein [Sandarakinorhabdus sp.]
MDIRLPYLIFLGDARSPLAAKTAFGVRDWRPDACAGQWALPGGTVDLGLTPLAPAAAVATGAKTLLVGIAPVGGRIEPQWVPAIVEAIEAGLDIASGMHTRLASVPAIAEAAARHGRTLHDIRHADRAFPVGTGIKRPGKRLLAVGTDCALGKKYTALALARAFTAAGHKATFRATGQTGIMISGGGVAIDAVVADFIAGAAESLSPANAPDHWDIIEGQGSLLHPGYAGVSLGLLHGSQPDALVLCHDPFRTEIDEYPGFAIPPLGEVIALNLSLARRTNPAAVCPVIALNTSAVDAGAGALLLAAHQDRYGLPCFDPMRSDLAPIVAAVVAAC